jgi:lipopolysaccharide export system permease protein
VLLKARNSGGTAARRTGAWLKEKRSTPQGEHSFRSTWPGPAPAVRMVGIRILSSTPTGRLMTRIEAREGRVGDDGTWTLSDAKVARWPLARAEGAPVHGAAKAGHAASGPAR